MAAEEATPQPRYLTEVEERALNYEIVTPGYIRNVAKIKVEDIPSVIIDLCNVYTMPSQYENEGDDPLNFISDQDIKLSDQYKKEGNEYFKLRDYTNAITKYTTAIRYNPNNHLIYCNRAFCHYLNTNYDEALSDIKNCTAIQPTFAKGWYRYGLILDKLGEYGKAGVVFLTGSNLDTNWNECKPESPYKSYYQKYLKALKDDLDKSKALEFIENFPNHSTEQNWHDTFMEMAKKYPAIHKLLEMRQNDEFINQDFLDSMNEIMKNETELIKQKQDIDFQSNILQSQCMYCYQRNIFKFDTNPSNGNEMWDINWSSTAQIDNNKRIICVNLMSSSNVILNNYMQHAVPNGKEIIQLLLRAMTFSNLTKQSYIKPKLIRICWRLRNEFDAISKAMYKIGVRCFLQTKEQNDASCESAGTNVNGWNHL